MNTEPKNQWHEATKAVRSAIDEDTQFGAVAPPIYLTSNYSFEGYGQKRQYDYARSGNPTRDQLGQAIGDLENGCPAVITTSGMGAIHLVCQLLCPDDLIIAPHDCYGGTFRLLSSCAEKGAFKLKFMDLTQDDLHEELFKLQPKMILIETPSNPLLRLTDIKKITEGAKKHQTLVVADNTFLSPIFQKPLDLGADIVVHSTTKYLNGHGDIVGGAVTAKAPELQEKLAWWGNCIGITGAPFDSYLTLRGLRTLVPRIEYQSQTAGDIAIFLENHPAVDKVHYPGLKSHPNHALANAQQTGFGAMISFELTGTEADIKIFLAELTQKKDGNLFTLAESLGGFESLITHPASMTHAAMTPQARETAGIGVNLLRLSIGLEHISDLKEALNSAFKALSSSALKAVSGAE